MLKKFFSQSKGYYKGSWDKKKKKKEVLMMINYLDCPKAKATNIILYSDQR